MRQFVQNLNPPGKDRPMQFFHVSAILAACLLLCRPVAAVNLPLEVRMEATPFNLQSLAGVPYSATNELGEPVIPTSGQFGGFHSFGGIPGLDQVSWLAVSNSAMLKQGTTPFSAEVAKEMRLPLATTGNSVLMAFRRVQVGAPYFSRQLSFSFGSIVSVPETDEQGRLQTAVPKETYWLAEPYSTNMHQDSGYYWSRHARQVFAIQAGPIMVTWRKAGAYTAATVPGYTNLSGTLSFETNGPNINLLYTVRYVVSAAASKPPRNMYWTEKEFSDLGKPIVVPAAKVGAVNIVYNRDFPETVAREYEGPGYTVPGGTTNQVFQELRTLWYERGNILAYNQEGRVFVELLGDGQSDESYHHLGFEIVDVSKRPVPRDVSGELGERVSPPPPESLAILSPEPVLQASGKSFAYQHSTSANSESEFYATRETRDLNDYQVHWMEEGLCGLRWPRLLARYQFRWPADVSKYSHYLRPVANSAEEAQLTGVPLDSQNAPVIEYQDALDFPRARLTQDFKFYTWLDATHPAHRTLLRLHAGEGNIAFERVFSWLESSLAAANFAADPVATNLVAWDPERKIFDWPDELTAPRVVRRNIEVGERITAPAGELGAAGDYLAGYINPGVGTGYNINAYVNPLTEGFQAANRGAIVPVNAIPNQGLLQVWWFRTNSSLAGLNAGNTTKGFTAIHWPAALGIYTLRWPDNPREIVLASQLGSGTLDPFETLGSIYYQNNPRLPGYNPNEEHALMAGGVAYATRDDLNVTNTTGYSSHPYVLVEYQAQDGRPAMAVFKVLREKPSEGYVFDYIVEAGKLFQPPMPLPLLGKPIEGQGDSTVNYNHEPVFSGGDLPAGWNDSMTNGSYSHYRGFSYRDRNQDLWVYRGLHTGPPALRVGTYQTNTGTFAPLSPATAVVGQPFAYHVHASRRVQALRLSAPEGLPEWLTINGLSLQGTPSSSQIGLNKLSVVVEDRYDQRAVTNILLIDVVQTGLAVVQNPLRLSCSNQFTGSLVTHVGRPPYLAESPVYANSFTMRFYYQTQDGFAWPGVANPPPAGTIVPYLRPYAPALGAFAGNGASKNTPALDVVYRPVWPSADPKDSTKPLPNLPFGATLTGPQFGLPGVRDMRTARIVYQQSIAASIGDAPPSAILHDPTREKTAELAAQGLQGLPGGIKADYYQGKYFFPKLPPHLAERVFFDPSRGAKGALVFQGQFKQEVLGESYLLLNVLRGTDLGVVKGLCPAADSNYGRWTALVDALATRVETFYENPAQPGSYIPLESWTASVSVGDLAAITNDNTAVVSYALSATGPGDGYVTLIENGGTAFTQPGEPVSMHVFRVGGALHSGETKVIAAANPLNEQLTLQHSADMAGHFDEYEYEWKIAAPIDGSPPEPDETMSRYLKLGDIQTNVPRCLLGGAGIQSLSDNYVVMRYRPINPSHPFYRSWSEWTKPALAEGWIKRVLAGINPFNQRITDLFNNQVNTDVSMLTQAGRRWEGDVALNLETMNRYGLIEIYETVLRRGRMLSIESGYNFGPANDALLLAAGYLHDLYMMEANEAWADAANPTIGIGTKDQAYGDIATALFAFKGQAASLLEEELSLLRGRDDFLQPGVELSPVYNRLVWNYTRGIDAGEVIYALNYNIQEDPNLGSDGIIGANDAAHMYPQGHGDAYGHYLTALKGYHSLLMNSRFDWVPRTEAVNILGQPVQVDYQDERKFASAAVALARAGRQIFDLTWRKDYQPVKTAGWQHFASTRVNQQRQPVSTRFWGMDHWAARAGQGAYLNWVVGNAILPDVDANPAHEGIQKIDRTTVPELREICSLAEDLQTAMNNADAGLSPLGVPQDSLAFDINPSVVVGAESGTHFEQLYQRAKVALNNAVASFDDAKDVTRMMRCEQNSLAEFQAGIARQELAYTHALIALYGAPYPDDLGPGKTYKQGYVGPDLVHFAYVDNAEVTFPGILQPSNTFELKLNASFLTNFSSSLRQTITAPGEVLASITSIPTDGSITITLDAHGFFKKPAAWTSRRASPGELQNAISQVISARAAALEALADTESQRDLLNQSIALFNSKADLYSLQHGWDVERARLVNAVEGALFTAKMILLARDTFSDTIANATKTTLEALPQSTIAGMAMGGDLLSSARGAVMASYMAQQAANSGINFAKEFAVGAFKLGQESYARVHEATVINPALYAVENHAGLYELSKAMSDLQTSLFTINHHLQQLDDATRHYRALASEGDRIQQERETFRQSASAVVQGYRTRDAAFRIFRNEKLERYKTLFDLAARYASLAANAYDYETGQLSTRAGRSFVNRIINARALGVVRGGEPQYAGSNTGDPGLSSALGEMKADWDVLRGRLGFNNPDAYGTTVSLRTEFLRILPTSDGDANWKDTLQRARVPNLLTDEDVRRYCLQIGNEGGLPVPGIVLTFNTMVYDGLNLFGNELAAGDHAFSSSSFATKIFGVGVALEGYRGMDSPAANSGAVTGSGAQSPSDPPTWYLDPLGLSATPYIYLIPVGVDAMRSPPLGDTGAIRTWKVHDIAIPMPFNIGASDFSTHEIWQSTDTLTEIPFAIRKHQAFRPVSSASCFTADLYAGNGTLQRSQFTSNRLVGRSVWNTQWKLVIPGKTLLNDPNEGLARFLETVKDVKLHFVTYSYSGN